MNILGRSTAGLSPGFALKPGTVTPTSHILLLQERDRKGGEANELRVRDSQPTSSSSRVNVRAKGREELGDPTSGVRLRSGSTVFRVLGDFLSLLRSPLALSSENLHPSWTHFHPAFRVLSHRCQLAPPLQV